MPTPTKKTDQKCDNRVMNWQTNKSHSYQKWRSFILQTFLFQQVILWITEGSYI